MSELDDFRSTLRLGTIISSVFEVLSDRRWHCRECSYGHTGTTQIAGGGGIQGLERGTKSRPGLILNSQNFYCESCGRSTRQDRWEGEFQAAIPYAAMPRAFASRVTKLLGGRDVVEQSERAQGELVVDHKLPLLRWTPEEAEIQTNYGKMDDGDIRSMFQLLKKGKGSGNHNLLKSRACERCFATGERGTPFGIQFFYAGSGRWMPADERDSSGCIGCGWYDFDAWREALNQKLQGGKTRTSWVHLN